MTANLHITHEQPPTCVYGGQVCGCVRTLIHCYMRLKWNYFKSGKQWNEEYLPISVGGERGKNKYYAHWHQRHRGHPHPTSPPFAKSLVEKYKNNNSNNNSNHHHHHLIRTCKYTSNWNVVSSSCFLNSHPIPSRLLGVGGGAQNFT